MHEESTPDEKGTQEGRGAEVLDSGPEECPHPKPEGKEEPMSASEQDLAVTELGLREPDPDR